MSATPFLVPKQTITENKIPIFELSFRWILGSFLQTFCVIYHRGENYLK